MHSDIDYVCIHTDREVPIKKLKRHYPEISFLSLETIRRMKEKGSLFLTHLDIDGSVVVGNEFLLSEIAGFRPCQSTLEEAIIATQSFIADIKWFPASHLGALWLDDVLFVAFRNILYCSNALNSIYLFSLKEAMQSYGLSSEHMDIIYRAREGKYAFRSRMPPDQEAVEADIDALSLLATTFTQTPVIFKMGGFTDWNREWRCDYWDERFIERAIINGEVEDQGFRKRLKVHNYNRRALTAMVRSYVEKAQRKRVQRRRGSSPRMP